MPPKSNVELGPGQIYLKGLDESEGPFDISDTVSDLDVEYADDSEPITIRNVMEATIECEPVEINREWTLAYCRVCHQPIPIIQFDALTLGTTGWTCPLCTIIKRMRERGKTR